MVDRRFLLRGLAQRPIDSPLSAQECTYDNHLSSRLSIKNTIPFFPALVYSATRQESIRELFTANIEGAKTMSKGMDSRKQTKKAPAKTLKEKRAEKKAKKEANRSWK